jgi:antitoxin component of MazEF toxin-antitoxin module
MAVIGIRKVQELSRSHSIVIPHKWVKENNLKKGQELLIETNPDGSIKISKQEV